MEKAINHLVSHLGSSSKVLETIVLDRDGMSSNFAATTEGIWVWK